MSKPDELQALLDEALEENEALKKDNASLKDDLKAAHEDLAKLREALGATQAAAGAKAPIPAGPPVVMTTDLASISINVGGLKKYTAKAGEFIKVEAAHVGELLSHSFRHLTPAESELAAKKAK